MYQIVILIVLLSAFDAHGTDTKSIPCPVDQVICPHDTDVCCSLVDQFCAKESEQCEDAFLRNETTKEQRKVICCQVLNEQFPDQERIPELQRVCTYRLGLLSWNSTCNEEVDKNEVDENQSKSEKAAGCSGAYPTNVKSDKQKKKFCCNKLNATDEESECVVRTCTFFLGNFTWKDICSGGDKEKCSGTDKGSSSDWKPTATLVGVYIGIVLLILLGLGLCRADMRNCIASIFNIFKSQDNPKESVPLLLEMEKKLTEMEGLMTEMQKKLTEMREISKEPPQQSSGNTASSDDVDKSAGTSTSRI